MKLINKPVERVFVFGCSFTHYSWTTWPEFVAFDLDVPYYNYGKSGAGNQYIANSLVQANIKHKFTENDLIMVSWTNVCREDRWRKNTWVVTGNIYTQDYFDKKFIKEWADPVGYMVRDFALINLVNNLLTGIGCQYHMMSMCNIAEQVDQISQRGIPPESAEKHKEICDLYRADLDKILPSFFECLWDNNIYNNKLVPDKAELGTFFSDGHPSPKEHFAFLRRTFTGHKFRPETAEQAVRAHDSFVKFIHYQSDKLKKPFAMHELGLKETAGLRATTTVKSPIQSEII